MIFSKYLCKIHFLGVPYLLLSFHVNYVKSHILFIDVSTNMKALFLNQHPLDLPFFMSLKNFCSLVNYFNHLDNTNIKSKKVFFTS